MINNISYVDTSLQQMNVVKTAPSHGTITTPPILGFKTPFLKEKAIIRVKKFKRADNIMISGEIDDDYVDIVETAVSGGDGFSFISPGKVQTKFLKNCYIIDYIQSPKPRNGLGTEAIKNLAEKAMFDSRADGRIVTYCAPVWKESSPALFFYKLGFRFMDSTANDYMKECLAKKIPDLPPQKGMMYLPKGNLNKLLRYGEMY